jgi:anti-sigma factor (TIGR02949 family)
MKQNTPMDCEQVLRLLFEYLDGEVSDEQQRHVSDHLTLCRSCFSRAEFEKRLRLHLDPLGEEVVPSELEQRVRTIIARFPDAER